MVRALLIAVVAGFSCCFLSVMLVLFVDTRPDVDLSTVTRTMTYQGAVHESSADLAYKKIWVV